MVWTGDQQNTDTHHVEDDKESRNRVPPQEQTQSNAVGLSEQCLIREKYFVLGSNH